MIKLWGLLDELLTSIIKLLIDGRNQCESQFCVVLVVKRAQKKKRLDETHFFTIPIWILKVTIQTSILRIMFFSLCRAVRTTAKKKKNYNLTVTRVRRFFLSQLAAISQSDWPVPFSIGMQTTLLASTCECQHWKVLEMDALISTSLDLPEICRQTNAKEPYWLHVVCHGQLNLTDMSIREQNGKKIKPLYSYRRN